MSGAPIPDWGGGKPSTRREGLGGNPPAVRQQGHVHDHGNGKESFAWEYSHQGKRRDD